MDELIKQIELYKSKGMDKAVDDMMNDLTEFFETFKKLDDGRLQ